MVAEVLLTSGGTFHTSCFCFALYLITVAAGGGKGTLTAEVLLTSGRTAVSAPTPINFPSRTSKTGNSSYTGSGCADISTGLFLSPALVLPNRTLANTPQQIKACSNGGQVVSLPLGPFSEEACGSYMVRAQNNCCAVALLLLSVLAVLCDSAWRAVLQAAC